jgi:gamma-glutamylcyclotransferase (GGCT)/AIG2-like uncharacterized protein YtfP
MNIFTYGSLMFRRVWSIVVTGHYSTSQARLFGYQRRKIKGETYPALIPGKQHDFVDGIIYFKVDLKDRIRLDNFEGHYYTKIQESFRLSDQQTVRAQVYVFKPEYRGLVEKEPWNPEWFKTSGIHDFMTAYRGYNRIHPTDDKQ